MSIQSSLRETGQYDVRGIPICVGDLIRVHHFRHYKRQQQMWLYFRVAESDGKFVVYGWDRPEKHQCLLIDCGISTAEILTGPTLQQSNGILIMWNERKRRKPYDD